VGVDRQDGTLLNHRFIKLTLHYRYSPNNSQTSLQSFLWLLQKVTEMLFHSQITHFENMKYIIFATQCTIEVSDTSYNSFSQVGEQFLTDIVINRY
jgi:hypothetical protein